MWAAMCCISIHSELEGTSEIFAWLAFYPSVMSGYEGFLFGSEGLSRHLSHLQYKNFCVNQLSSYCITFPPEPDKH